MKYVGDLEKINLKVAQNYWCLLLSVVSYLCKCISMYFMKFSQIIRKNGILYADICVNANANFL